MRRIRQIESGFGRALLALGAFLLATLVVGIVLGILNSNLIWGEANQYARVPIPGKQKIHLPAGKVQVNVAAALPGRGNETPEPLLPKMSLSLVSVDGGASPTIEEDIGGSSNANDDEVDTQRRAFAVQVPASGTYLAVARGDFTGYGFNAQLWFGHEPSPLHGGMLWIVAAIIAAIGALLFAGLGLLRIRRADRKKIDAGPSRAREGVS